MTSDLEVKLKQLPNTPGVYFHKNNDGEIIYVGKAAVLKNRVRQYFHQTRVRDTKTEALIAEIVDTDWVEVETELDALFLEAEMVRRYMPRYNILLRDDKSMVYVRIDYNSEYPTVTTTRRPLDDGARYFGPYLSTLSVRQALKLLRRIFPYATRGTPGQKRATLHYHLGLDPGLEEGKTSLSDYRANLRKLMQYLKGGRVKLMKQIEKDMKSYADAKDFEKAAKARNQLFALRNLTKQVVFSDKEFLDISKDHALNELTELLGLYEEQPERSHLDGVQGGDEQRAKRTSGTESESRRKPTQQSAKSSGSVLGSAQKRDRVLRSLRRIEGYDISHQQGTDVVASMVVFTNGASDKTQYRKFKTKKDHNNDFYNMHETIRRRFSERNIKSWGKPNLVLIDGGKGQLDVAIRARDESGDNGVPFIGLAKRQEQIVVHKNKSGVDINLDVVHRLGGFMTESTDYILVNLPTSTHLIKLLQRIRDESHRFAVSYHSILKTRRQTTSILESIPGIGPATRKKLIKAFGSARAVGLAPETELAAIIGSPKAKLIKAYVVGSDYEQQA